MKRAFLRLSYFLSWSAFFGLAFLIATTVLAAKLHESWRLLPDDDWPLYLWPIGCGGGWWFAVRSQGWRTFQYACILFSSISAIVFTISAINLYQRSVELIGVNGPMSGLGESITAAMFAVFAISGATVLIGNLAIIFSQRVKSK